MGIRPLLPLCPALTSYQVAKVVVSVGPYMLRRRCGAPPLSKTFLTARASHSSPPKSTLRSVLKIVGDINGDGRVVYVG